MKDLSKEILAYALHNAIEYSKTSPDRILPKLFQHGLKREEIKEIMPKLQEIVKKVNSLKPEEIKKQFQKYKDIIKVHEEKPRELSELPNANKKMVFRLAPFPSGALHIGNAKTYLLNALYAEKYKAKTLLIMDDTIGSEEKQPINEAYELIQQGLDWLNVKYSKPIIYKSDRLKIYYDYAEQLIKKDKAYVCHCVQEILKENRAKGIECGCRQFPIKEQLKRWKEIFKAKSGSAILRIKTSMQNPNPAFRDRVLFKISDRPHPRVKNKYRVWPTLEMTWAIDDHLLGITHVLRGNDLAIESDMEKYIWDIFGWPHITLMHTGLVKIDGAEAKVSKSKAQKEVLSGQLAGWDDPRTWSIQSLTRRGIKPEAVREFVKEIGLNKQDIITPIDSLYSINRKIIDSSSNRYSFVENPLELEIKNAPDIKKIQITIHPDKKETRDIEINKISISNKDFKSLNGQEIRLLHLYNIKLGEPSKFTSSENKEIPRINWVTNPVKTRILMPEGNWLLGASEQAISKLKPGQIIQFERFGFVRFDKFNQETNTYDFWFAHK